MTNPAPSDSVYETELGGTREELAEVLHGLADGVRAGTVTFATEADPVEVGIPATLALEIEYEVEGTEASLEAELEWAAPADDGNAATREPAASRDSDGLDSGPDADSTEAGTEGDTKSGGSGTDSTVSEQPAETTDRDLAPDATGATGVAAIDDTGAEPTTGSEQVAPVPEARTSGGGPVGAGDGSATMARFEVFGDGRGEWRWRLRHRNGNVIATSGEGYTQKHNARKGLRSVMRNAAGAETRDEPTN